MKILKSQGDAELIVKQVQEQYTVKYTRLWNYRNRVWDEIENLDAFSIQVIPKEQNARVDMLVSSSSLLLPCMEFKDNQYKVEVLFRPNVSNNVESWQVFSSDK